MIELAEMSETDLPLDHGSLLSEVRRVRAGEVSQCQVLSDAHAAAVQRLIQYGGQCDRYYAKARFLDPKEPAAQPGDGRAKRVETQLAAQSAARRLVEGLAAALENEAIDMTCFQPNHFATLSIYYDKFLRTDDSRPRNGLARWCFGLKAYVRGGDIEPEAERRYHLALQCLPRHYDDSGAPLPAGLDDQVSRTQLRLMPESA